MNLDDIIDRGDSVVSHDVDAFLAAAALSTRGVAVAIGSDGASIELIETGSTLITGVGVPAFTGILRNAPEAGGVVLQRVAGYARCTYGDTVAAGDLLMVDPLTQKLIPFVLETSGHEHGSTRPTVRRVVTVTDWKNEAVIGADPGDFTTSLEYDVDATITPASESVVITEDAGGGGRYVLTIEPNFANRLYIVNVVYVDPGSSEKWNVTPSEHQFTSGIEYQKPTVGTVNLIVGTAVIPGEVDKEGIVFIRPQIF